MVGGLPGGGIVPAGAAGGPLGVIAATLTAGVGIGGLEGGKAQDRARAIERSSREALTSSENVQRFANLALASGAIEGGDEVQALERAGDFLREANNRLGQAIVEGGELAEKFAEIGVGTEGLAALQKAFVEDPLAAFGTIERLIASRPTAERTFFREELYGGEGARLGQIIGEQTPEQFAEAQRRARGFGVTSDEQVARLAEAEAARRELDARLRRLRRTFGGFVSDNYSIYTDWGNSLLGLFQGDVRPPPPRRGGGSGRLSEETAAALREINVNVTIEDGDNNEATREAVAQGNPRRRELVGGILMSDCPLCASLVV